MVWTPPVVGVALRLTVPLLLSRLMTGLMVLLMVVVAVVALATSGVRSRSKHTPAPSPASDRSTRARPFGVFVIYVAMTPVNHFHAYTTSVELSTGLVVTQAHCYY